MLLVTGSSDYVFQLMTAENYKNFRAGYLNEV